VGEIIEDLLLIWSAARPDEYANRIEFVPL
jgi:hypothetical protein